MSPGRLLAGAACALTLAAVVSCAARKPPSGPVAPGSERSVGLYKVKLVDADGSRQRFRLWLFAELPDRLHGEVISPVGGTHLIVDAGDDRLSIAVVRERVAFVGHADPDIFEALLGVRLSLRDLVRLLLTGKSPDGDHVVTRVARREVDLPDQLEVRSATRQLSLILKHRQAYAPPNERIGCGEPPPGMEQRSLDELDLLDLRAGG